MDILVYLAILPVVLLMWYIHKKDIDKEPKDLLTKIFIFGCLSVIPILIVELILNNFFDTEQVTSYINMFINVFISVALVEELGKWCVAYFFGYNHDAYDHRYDAIVYAVFASLGFAVVENVLYVISAEQAFQTAIMRAILSVPSHACDGVIMGYFIGLAKEYKTNNDSRQGIAVLFSILLPSITHAIYDSLIFQSIATENEYLLIIFIVFVIVQYIICFIIINKTSKIETNFDGTPAKKEITKGVSNYNATIVNSSSINYCPNCGNKIELRFCSNCGFDTKS